MTLSIQEAQAKRDHGMSISEIKANNDSPEWSNNAVRVVRSYILSFDQVLKGEKFLIEDVREWGEFHGFIEAPANGRAWGAIARRCAREGLIRQDGYLPARSSNMSPKCAWVSNL